MCLPPPPPPLIIHFFCTCLSSLPLTVRDLAPPGDLAAPATFPFAFTAVELAHETYAGVAARLRYIVRVSITRPYAPTLAREWGLAVRNPVSAPPLPAAPASEGGGGGGEPAPPPAAADLAPGTGVAAAAAPPPPTPLKMEVGIEDCLHIEVTYDAPAYALTGVVTGSVAFLLVRIRLKHMELELRRRETAGGGAGARSEAATLGRFELMDGAPARGEAVPVRLWLGAYDNLTPTYRCVGGGGGGGLVWLGVGGGGGWLWGGGGVGVVLV